MVDDDPRNDDATPETDAGGAGDGGGSSVPPSCAGEDDDDRGGYGRPPKAHRFRPGQSGNPRGRPTGAKSLRTIIRKELSARVRITENGRSRSASKMEVMIKRLTEQGAKGDLKAISKLIELGAQVFGMEDEPERDAPLSAVDQAMVDAARKRRDWLKGVAGKNSDEGRPET